MSETSKICLKCQAIIPDQAPQGLCPKCVLAAVAETVSAPVAIGGFGEAPPLEKIAAAFPQLEIVELIGAGGMAAVYKARQPKLERWVALKVLPHVLAADAAFAERFGREARVLARLNHSNIVTIHDFGQSGGYLYLLMEYVDGVNLRSAMAAGRFTPSQALAVVPHICEALQYAHDEGILHRDIKPENILLDARGRVKIADFGIAKLLGEKARDIKLTASGAAVGTPHYMAPEQLEHPQDVDQRADIYSLGVVLYEMLTGELPIGRFAPPSEKSAVTRQVDEAVLRALEKERERRYHSASEMKTRVEHIASTDKPPGDITKVSPNRLAPHPSKLDWVAAALTLLSLLPGGLLIYQVLAMLCRWGFVSGLELAATAGLWLLLAVPGALLGLNNLASKSPSERVLSRLAFSLFATLCWPFIILDGALYTFIFYLIDSRGWVNPEVPSVLAIAITMVIALGLNCALIWTLLRQLQPTSGEPTKRKVAFPLSVKSIGLGLITVLFATSFWWPIPVKNGGQSSRPEPIEMSSSDHELSIEGNIPPRQTFTIFCSILSNGVPLKIPGMSSDIPASSGPDSGRFKIHWRQFDTNKVAPHEASWEIVVENGNSGTIVARLRPRDLPILDWKISNLARRIEIGSSRLDAPAFEIARALQERILDGSGPIDWSIRLALVSYVPHTTLDSRIKADFVLPAGQVALFEMVTRKGQEIVAIPGLSAYVIAAANSNCTGTFRCSRTAELITTGPWRVEINGPSGTMNSSLIAVREPPRGYIGSSEGWYALKPDQETIQWVSSGKDSYPPAFGLRFRTRDYGKETGIKTAISSAGLGTNWMRAFDLESQR